MLDIRKSIILFVAIFFLVPPFLAAGLSDNYHVHFIDVGQADATLILDEGKDCILLIDAGDTRYPGSAKQFKSYLKEHLPVDGEIDLAIASHPHNDHIGSMKWVLETYRVKNYVDSGQLHSTVIYDELMKAVAQQTHHGLRYGTFAKVTASQQQPCGESGPKIEFLYPQSGLDPDFCENNQNNCSVIVKIHLGATTFLFPGDAEEEEEELLLADGALKTNLQADVLKVPHHGSDTSSKQAFLNAVNPTWMVISAGTKNVGTNKGYKHPKYSTVIRLLGFAGQKTHDRKIDAYDRDKESWEEVAIWGRLFATPKDGTVELKSNGTTISVVAK